MTHMCAKWHTWRDRAAKSFIGTAIIICIIVLAASGILLVVLSRVEIHAKFSPMRTTKNILVIDTSKDIQSFIDLEVIKGRLGEFVRGASMIGVNRNEPTRSRCQDPPTYSPDLAQLAKLGWPSLCYGIAHDSGTKVLGKSFPSVLHFHENCEWPISLWRPVDADLGNPCPLIQTQLLDSNLIGLFEVVLRIRQRRLGNLLLCCDRSGIIELRLLNSIVGRLSSLFGGIGLSSGVERIEPSDEDQENRTRCLNPYWCFVEIAAALSLSALALFLFVCGGVVDDWRWYWRLACWTGSGASVALCWKLIHVALAYRCWFG